MPNVKYPDTLVVHVTQEDIDAGVPGDCRRCPAALAALRAVPGAVEVRVDDDMIEFREPHPDTAAWAGYMTLVAQYVTPPELLRFIEAFDTEADYGDSNEIVVPFTFTAERYVRPETHNEGG